MVQKQNKKIRKPNEGERQEKGGGGVGGYK